ncbi:MAG: flavodoxin [Helicobacter sp.]|nr:flavodoxin [Helicobacter sp.]
MGIFYGTDGGDTEKVVEQIAEKLREYVDVKIFDVAKASRNDLRRYENLIFASPTYGEGDLQSDWEDFLPKLSANDVAGKTIAFVGLGDQDGYGETFGEGIVHIYQKLAHRAIVVGKTSTDDYQFECSKSVVRGKFIGLMIDEVNQDDQTEDRIAEWVEDIVYKFN